jgi:hypothetical protein
MSLSSIIPEGVSDPALKDEGDADDPELAAVEIFPTESPDVSARGLYFIEVN